MAKSTHDVTLSKNDRENHKCDKRKTPKRWFSEELRNVHSARLLPPPLLVNSLRGSIDKRGGGFILEGVEVSEEEKKSEGALDEAEKAPECASEVPRPFFKVVIPWLAVCVFTLIAVIFSRVATQPWLYDEELALVSALRFVTLVFSLVWFVLFFVVLQKIPFLVRGIVLVVFFLPVAVSIYLQNVYGEEIDLPFVLNCLNTHWEEARAFISLHAIGILVGFVRCRGSLGMFL